MAEDDQSKVELEKENESGAHFDRLERQRTIVGRIVGIAIMLVTVLLVLRVVNTVTIDPRTQDASVGAHYIGMAPEVEGRLIALHVHDNGCVDKGQLLAEIDSEQYEYNLKRALADQRTLEEEIVEQRRMIVAGQSQVAASRASVHDSRLGVQSGDNDIREATSNVVFAAANLTAANQQYGLADTTLKRNEPLAAHRYISREELDQYRTNRDVASQKVEAAKAQLKIAESNLRNATVKREQNQVNVSKSQAVLEKDAYSVPILDTLLAERPARGAAVDRARLDLSHARIVAPFAGCTVALNISQGAYARPGSALFTLIDESSWYVDAAFREAQLQHIRVGMRADVFLMSDPHHPLEGVVQSISSGVSSSDSSSDGGTPGVPGSLPVVQRSLNWVRLASRYAVRIHFHAGNPSALRVGATAEVAIRG